jgi:hypothetical protein
VNRATAGRVSFVAVAAVAHLAVWLVLRPDLAGPQWSEGHATGAWLALEAVAAVLVGVLAHGWRELVAAVLVGWALQAAHFVLVGAHYDDTLWGIGVFLQALVAAVAVALAVLADRLTSRG